MPNCYLTLDIQKHNFSPPLTNPDTRRLTPFMSVSLAALNTMEPPHSEFDPDADAEFVLQDPNKPNSFKFTKRKMKKKKKKSKKADVWGTFEPTPPEETPIPPEETPVPPEQTNGELGVQPSEAVETPTATKLDASVLGSEALEIVTDRDQKPTEIRMRVSSKHLSLASPVFKKMMSGPWEESIPENGIREIKATEWNVDAVVIVMNIIHGHHRKVPRSISLETLYNVAVIVDYYKCHEVTEVFAQNWLSGMEGDLPTSYSDESSVRMFASWVFSDSKGFQSMTELSMRQSSSLLKTTSFPLPGGLLGMFLKELVWLRLTVLIDEMDARREKAIEDILDALRQAQLDLCREDQECHYGFACSSMQLGSLMKQIYLYNLDLSSSLPPFNGHSVLSLHKMVSTLQSPTWYPTNSYSCDVHTCTLRDKLQPIVGGVLDGLQGLTLAEWPSTML